MKPARKFAHVSRRFYRPEQSHCAECQRRLRRAVTLTERTVITLEEVVKLVHAGYHCPDVQCAGHQRTYRSVRADALAIPLLLSKVDENYAPKNNPVEVQLDPHARSVLDGLRQMIRHDHLAPGQIRNRPC